MSKSVFHNIIPDNTPITEKLIFNFITAAELIGIMHECDDCMICQEACKRLRQIERKERKVMKNDNKMD